MSEPDDHPQPLRMDRRVDDTLKTPSGSTNDGPPAWCYEQLWKTGAPPELASFIAGVGPLSDEDLATVLRMDMYQRWPADRALPVEWYLNQFPQLANAPELEVDLIYTEFLQQEQLGRRPRQDEYLLRFPQHRETLRDQFALHAAIEEDDADSSELVEGRVATVERSACFPSISGYEILDEIGRGGIGVVYKALDLQLHRIVAIKLLLSGRQSNVTQLRRFRVEAEAAARLQHPNIIQVFDVGQHEGRPYLALEYVPGETLAQWTRHRPQPPREAAAIVETLARAVHYAHEQGVVHRDLKPGNVMICPPSVSGDEAGALPDALGASTGADSAVGRTLKITDFGLAKVANSWFGEATDHSTHTGDILGTPGYMSPEQAAGRTGEIDVTSDVYSLGAILYDLLTGRPPFAGTTPVETLRQVAEQVPVQPTHWVRALPRDLQTICMKCLEKERHQRYRSALVLAEDLARFRADLPIVARPTSVAERLVRWCRRYPVVSMLIATVLLLAAALSFGVMIAGWIRSERDQAIANLGLAERAESQARTSQARALRAEQDAKIRNHLSQAIVYRERHDVGHRQRSLAEIDAALALDPSTAQRTELRTALIASLAHTDFSLSTTWVCPRGTVDIHPSFEKYAWGDLDGVIHIRRIADNSEIMTLRRPAPPDSRFILRFSPDGNYLASFAFDHHVIVWDLENGKEILDDVGCRWDLGFDFSADDKEIVIGHEREIRIFELPDATLKSTWPTDFAPWRVACSPLGDQVAISPEFSTARHRIQVFDTSTGEMVAELEADSWVYDIAWQSNGRTVAFSNDNRILLWHVGQSKPHLQFSGPLGTGVELAFSHDASLLASCGWNCNLVLWDVVTGARLCNGNSSWPRPRFSPDDHYVSLFQDGPRMGLYQVNQSRVLRPYLRISDEKDGELLNAAFSPDGRILAVGTPQGVGICDSVSGARLAFVGIGRVAYLQFDTAGQLFTASDAIRRWPIRWDEANANHLIVGPPAVLPMSGFNEIAVSRDGDRIVAARYDGATAFDFDHPQQSIYLGPHKDCRYVAISGDGKWAATGSHFGSKVCVWDAATGTRVAALPVETSSWVRFSPDQRWLATMGINRLWEVDSWKPGPEFEGLICGFSPDCKVVVVSTGYGSLRLMDPDTGRERAELLHPAGQVFDRSCFSPNGNTLVGIASTTATGVAWDLGRIREELAARGLDWDMPGWPRDDESRTNQGSSVNDRASSGDPVRAEVTIESGVPDLSPEERAQTEMNRLRKALAEGPDNAQALNALAWILATGPTEFQDATEAVKLAEKAVQLNPKEVNAVNTLGVAYYRAGRFQEAVQLLSSNLPHQDDTGLPYDLYFLAMGFHHLGDSARAHDYLVWANRWTDAHLRQDDLTPAQQTELTVFRQEAEMLIGGNVDR